MAARVPAPLWCLVALALALPAAAVPLPESRSTPAAAGARERALSVIVSAFVADAAAMSMHWIYDPLVIAALVRNSSVHEPEFFDPPHSPYYQYPLGENTPFGEQMFAILESLNRTDGVPSIPDLTQTYFDFYELESRPWTTYIDNCTRGFLANIRAGRTWPLTGDGDEEVNAVVHVLPIAAAAAIVPDQTLEGYLHVVDATIRIWQNCDAGVAFGMTFARILYEVVRFNTPVDTAIHAAAEALRTPGRLYPNPWDALFAHGLDKMHEWAPRPPFNVTREIGQGCDFPYHTFTANQFLLHNSSQSFVEAVRATIFIGGENAGRGMMVGSLLAAAQGLDASVPASWRTRTTRYLAVYAMATRVVGAASTTPARRFAAPARRARAEAARARAARNRSAAAVPVGNSPKCVGHSNGTDLTLGGNHSDDFRGLVSLYFATGGDNWTRNACWLNASVSLCSWDQVLCDELGRVRELRLSMNNLVGHLPNEIGLLHHLIFVQLVLNPDLTGPVPPGIANTSLEEFYAWETGLSGLPDNIGDVQTLACLDVSDCSLSALPPSLAQLRAVNTVYLDGNSGIACPLDPAVQSWLGSVEFHGAICP